MTVPLGLKSGEDTSPPVPPVDTPLMQTPTDSKFTLLQLTTHPELYKGVSECDTVGATFPNVSGAL